MRWVSYILALGIATSSTCGAENLFCLGGDLDHMSTKDEGICQIQMAAARGLISHYTEVRDWHFVVVCGESSWRAYSSFAHGDESYLGSAVAETDRTEKITFLRGEALLPEKQGSVEPRLLRVFEELNLQNAKAGLGTVRAAMIQPSIRQQ